MKVLFFSTYFYPYVSGSVNLPYYLSRYLAGQNNEVTVLTFNYNRLLKSEENIDGVSIKRVNFLFKISKGFISPQVFFPALRLAKQADIVFLNFPNFEGLAIALIAFLCKKKVVGLFACWVDLGSGIFKKIANSFLNLSMKIQLNLCTEIVPITLDYAQIYLNKYTNKIKSCIYPPVIKCVVSNVYFNKLKILKKSFFVVGFVGRIAREKGIEYLLESLEKLDESKILFLIAGPSGNQVAGEKDYYDKIAKLTDLKKINCRFLGKLSEGELGAFYSLIDVLVLPSINKTEAFGIVQAEAMLFGKPVIASDLPGVRVPINETGMGILVEPKNANKIAAAILEINKNYANYVNKDKINRANELFKINHFYQSWQKVLLIKK